uniref:Phospholipase A(2) n=1 Tax=Parascaris univalens TaxID=6257 RepID=A0A915CA30_PARUN
MTTPEKALPPRPTPKPSTSAHRMFRRLLDNRTAEEWVDGLHSLQSVVLRSA